MEPLPTRPPESEKFPWYKHWSLSGFPVGLVLTILLWAWCVPKSKAQQPPVPARCKTVYCQEKRCALWAYDHQGVPYACLIIEKIVLVPCGEECTE